MSQENPSKNISPERLLQGYLEALKKVSSVQSILKKLGSATVRTDSLCPAAWRPSAGD